MQAIDFLDKLLQYDHQDRLTAKEAMVNFCVLTFSYFLAVGEYVEFPMPKPQFASRKYLLIGLDFWHEFSYSLSISSQMINLIVERIINKLFSIFLFQLFLIKNVQYIAFDCMLCVVFHFVASIIHSRLSFYPHIFWINEGDISRPFFITYFIGKTLYHSGF